MYSSGVDVITSGNHIWDQKEIIEHIECDKRLLRPCNYPIGTPGLGYGAYELKNGSTVIVINVMCRLFMDIIDDPFKSVDEILSFIDKKFSNAIIILDKNSKEKIEKSIRNIPNVKVTDVNHFSAFDIVKYKRVVFTESSIKELEKRYS